MIGSPINCDYPTTDFNPIEKPFSKIKSILERIAARTVETLETAVGEALQSFTPQERMNYFAASDYDAGCSDSALTASRRDGNPPTSSQSAGDRMNGNYALSATRKS